MSKMRRTLISLVGVLAAAGAAQAQTGRPRWQVDAGERFCTVIRNPASDAEPTVAIRNNPYRFGADLLIWGPALPSVNGPVRIVTDQGESPPLRAATSARPDGSTLLQVQHLGGVVTPIGLDEARFVEIRRGDRVLVHVPLSIPKAARDAVGTCQDDALAQAGFGPDLIDLSTVSLPTEVENERTGRTPRAIGNPGAWLSDADYPPAAMREGRAGSVGILLRVEPDGSVGRCFVGLSSGSADLDTATCRAVTDRGRWAPFEGRPRLSRLTFTWTVTS